MLVVSIKKSKIQIKRMHELRFKILTQLLINRYGCLEIMQEYFADMHKGREP